MKMLDTSSANQRAIIVRHCREHGRLNTTEACEQLGIMRLAARICELKDLGYEFITYKKNTVDMTGTKHRGVADYVLIREPKVKSPNHQRPN